MSKLTALPRSFYLQPTLVVARQLLGKLLLRRTSAGLTSGIIVETEAYLGLIDPAAHSYRGKTQRNAVMFGPGGYAYVYFTYGIYYCFNVVTEEAEIPAAVLVRAIAPVEGIALMAQRRQLTRPSGASPLSPREVTNGPGKLCVALALTRADNGKDLTGQTTDELLIADAPPPPEPVYCSPRIGITQATEWPWRFFLAGNFYVSRGPRGLPYEL